MYRDTTHDDYTAALARVDEWRAELAALFTEFDLLALPTMIEPVPRIEDSRSTRLTACTVQANGAGVPVVALPVGMGEPDPGERAARRAVGRGGTSPRRRARARSRRVVAVMPRPPVDPLREYEKKRNFAATPEPAPAPPTPKNSARRRTKKPRFVVQEHHARRLHWDLRLEHDGVLWSWAVPKGIPMLNQPNHLAVRTEDHPMEYLTFRGDIPKGQYGAGTMSVWDSGTYEAEKLRDDEVIVTLHGKKVDGKYALFRTRGNQWMIHRMSPPGRPDAQRDAARSPPDVRGRVRSASHATTSTTRSR